MRFFDEFGEGDMMLTHDVLFKTSSENTTFCISMNNLSFDKKKLSSLFNEERLKQFFSSEFYTTISEHITPFLYSDIFAHALPNDYDARIALGVIRNHKIWVDDVRYNSEFHTLEYRGDLANPLDIAMRLFSTEEDVLPQEFINAARENIAFSQLAPFLSYTGDFLNNKNSLSSSFRAISDFPFGKNNEKMGNKFEITWQPSSIAMAFSTKLFDDFSLSGVDTNLTLAWLAAFDMCRLRTDFNYNTLLASAIKGQTPQDYVLMSARKDTPYELLYELWMNDIDESLCDDLQSS